MELWSYIDFGGYPHGQIPNFFDFLVAEVALEIVDGVV